MKLKMYCLVDHILLFMKLLRAILLRALLWKWNGLITSICLKPRFLQILFLEIGVF